MTQESEHLRQHVVIMKCALPPKSGGEKDDDVTTLEFQEWRDVTGYITKLSIAIVYFILFYLFFIKEVDY
jgi:hypothetical protein